MRPPKRIQTDPDAPGQLAERAFCIALLLGTQLSIWHKLINSWPQPKPETRSPHSYLLACRTAALAAEFPSLEFAGDSEMIT